jgi:dihydrofolate reductase
MMGDEQVVMHASQHPSPIAHHRSEVIIIAAVAEANRVIGRGLDLPWRIPADLRRFKALTLGHPLVMGHRTFESLLHQFGGPLKGRDNVVLTHRPPPSADPDVHFFPSMEEALAAYAGRERVFIGGGASVYAAALPFADRLELTLVEGRFEGDTFFPPYEHLVRGPGAVFERTACERHEAEGAVPAFRFETYTRKGQAEGAP